MRVELDRGACERGFGAGGCRRYLHHGVSSREGLDGAAAALRLVVGAVVGLGLHLDMQAVGP